MVVLQAQLQQMHARLQTRVRVETSHDAWQTLLVLIPRDEGLLRTFRIVRMICYEEGHVIDRQIVVEDPMPRA